VGKELELEKAQQEGAQAERERLSAIDRAAEGLLHMPNVRSLVAEMKADPSVTPEMAAIALLPAARSNQMLAALKADAPAVAPPVSESATLGGGDSPAALVAQARELKLVR
jgi:hypothetical protein